MPGRRGVVAVGVFTGDSRLGIREYLGPAIGATAILSGLYFGQHGPIRVRARTVWSQDRLQAVRFVVMHDVDRLTIAEHLDRMMRLREPLH